MKRIALVLSAVLLLLLFAGCSGNGGATESQTATEKPTDAPYIDTQINEPEWTLAEGELKLEDADNVYAEGKDILYFAIVGTNSDDVELLFRFDDVTANMLKQQSADNKYYMTLNGENIGYVTLNEDCTVGSIKGQHTYEEMTSIASRIRGLSE